MKTLLNCFIQKAKKYSNHLPPRYHQRLNDTIRPLNDNNQAANGTNRSVNGTNHLPTGGLCSPKGDNQSLNEPNCLPTGGLCSPKGANDSPKETNQWPIGGVCALDSTGNNFKTHLYSLILQAIQPFDNKTVSLFYNLSV